MLKEKMWGMQMKIYIYTEVSILYKGDHGCSQEYFFFFWGGTTSSNMIIDFYFFTIII